MIKPICPVCRKKAVVHYCRTSNNWSPIGFWCSNCGKPVDQIDRFDPIVYRMQIEEFLETHKKTYSVILSDPPWQFVGWANSNRSPERHYPTMPLESICSLPVKNIANSNSILFLWSPLSFLERALQVMKEWGFKYSTEFTWVKTAKNGNIRIGMGGNVRNTSEHLLIGKRGNFPLPKNNFPSTFQALQTDHSRKPPRSYEIIENMYPDASRIELFARYVYPGWTGVGNEAEPLPKNVYIPKGKMYTNSEQKSIQKFIVEVTKNGR